MDYVYAKPNPNGDGFIFGLTPEDYEKVRQGYGCPHCLEDFLGMAYTKCPFCKQDVAANDLTHQPTPEEWVAYLKKRKNALEEPLAPARRRR